MKQLTIKGIGLVECADGRWLKFKTAKGSNAVIHIDSTFSGDRLVHSIIREWAEEQTEAIPTKHFHD